MASMATADQGLISTFSYPRFLPSFLFDPTDEELVMHYLLKKLGGDGEKGDWVPYYDVVIPTVDLYAAYPWRICQQLEYPYGMGATEFYCFTPRRQRYDHGTRPVRTVGTGTWKANGGDEHIYHRGVLVGHKAHLTFNLAAAGSSGRATDKSALVNTHWVMHEYTLERPGFQTMVLCRVHNLRKEYEQKNHLWSPPWWEQQQQPEQEGCSRSSVDIGGTNRHIKKKKKMASPSDDGVVPPPQQLRQQREHDPKGKRPATDDDSEQRRRPSLMMAAAPRALVPPPVASSPQGPRLSAVTTAEDEDEDDLLSFARELEAELAAKSSEQET